MPNRVDIESSIAQCNLSQVFANCRNPLQCNGFFVFGQNHLRVDSGRFGGLLQRRCSAILRFCCLCKVFVGDLQVVLLGDQFPMAEPLADDMHRVSFRQIVLRLPSRPQN